MDSEILRDTLRDYPTWKRKQEQIEEQFLKGKFNKWELVAASLELMIAHMPERNPLNCNLSRFRQEIMRPTDTWRAHQNADKRWWFWDENDVLEIGPYQTKEDCLMAIKVYAEEYLNRLISYANFIKRTNMIMPKG